MHGLGRCNLHDYSNKCLHFTLNDSNESLNHDKIAARIKIMWEEQFVDPPIDYITSENAL